MFTEKGVAGDLLDFMEEFLKARPHLADRPFYVTGESYAVRSRVATSRTKPKNNLHDTA